MMYAFRMLNHLTAASLCLACASSANATVLASYNTAGLSGNAPQWNGTGTFDTTALPAVRGSGLGLGGGFNQFAATGVATTPTLNLANNDYVRFGFTLNFGAGAEYAVTSFRATCGSFGTGAAGMRYQAWGFFTNQAPFAITAPAPVNFVTTISFDTFPGNAVVFPGETAEIRIYFWAASGTQNGIAFISDNNSALADVEIAGIPIPAPSVGLFVSAAVAFISARRRR
jgi:hypothetical protein